MRHRGPDDQGVHVDRAAGVALGARRLSIIDVAGGHQPLSNEDGSVWAVLNGEIYNHPALRAGLEQRGHRFRSSTDTEVLVHLYEEYGDALVHALEGMFAFAVWDAGARRLLVARDRFGEKPLFYSERHGELAFASELTALRAGTDALDDVDPAALDAYFVLGYVPSPLSAVRGARQLPPGCKLTWEAAARTTAVEAYWTPPVHASRPSLGEVETRAEIGALLRASVRSRLISDVPLGVFLSGGIDSTLVAALAVNEAPVAIKTFTVGYDTGTVNETDAARATAAALGTEHHELVISSGELAGRAVRSIASLDQPLADHALLPLQALAEFARDEVVVAVGGEGADELFGGYPRYRWLARGERLRTSVPGAVTREAGAAVRGLPLPSRAGRLLDVLDPVAPYGRHVRWVTGRRPGLREHLYGPALRASRSGFDRRDELLSDGVDGLESRFMLLDQQRWLPDNVLAKADRATMRASLEFRTPFLHHQLAELLAGMPAQRLADGWGKATIAHILRELAPEAAWRRRKIAFRVPVGDWLRGPLLRTLADQIQGGSIFSEGWLEPTAAQQMLDAHAARSADNSDVLWPILVAGLWLDELRGDHG